MSEIGAFHVESEGRSRTRFTFLTGDTNWQIYGGKFISKRMNNGEFDYWLVMDAINMWEATGEEDQPQYNVSLYAVSPSQVNKDELNRAFDCMGMNELSEDILTNPITQVEALSEYGIYAMLWSNSGNNLKKLMRQAHLQADTIQFLFGFYMDRPENMIGSTGWDCIAGDLDRPLKDWQEQNKE